MAALRDFLVLTHSVLTSDAAKHLGVKLAILHKSQEVLVPVEFWSDLVVDFPGHLCIVRQLLITQKKQNASTPCPRCFIRRHNITGSIKNMVEFSD